MYVFRSLYMYMYLYTSTCTPTPPFYTTKAPLFVTPFSNATLAVLVAFPSTLISYMIPSAYPAQPSKQYDPFVRANLDVTLCPCAPPTIVTVTRTFSYGTATVPQAPPKKGWYNAFMLPSKSQAFHMVWFNFGMDDPAKIKNPSNSRSLSYNSNDWLNIDQYGSGCKIPTCECSM